MNFRNFAALLIAMPLINTAYAQQTQTSFKFDFGPGKVAPGYTQVLPTMLYSAETGFGFDQGTTPVGTDRGGKDALKSDFVSSDKPFFFSVKVPEGNYKVSVTFGDAKEATETSIKAESRRLMVYHQTTKPGKFLTKTFIVNIMNRKISNGTMVAARPKLDWDDRLTLEFDKTTALDAIEITKADNQVNMFLAGNSTVVNQDYEPWASWGQMIPVMFKPGVAVANYAESGLALSSFVGQRRLAKILDIAKPGDFVFVEFGHNDEKQKGPNDGADKSYTQRLRSFAAAVKEKGCQLVILTPTARRSFGADGKIINSHITELGDYPQAARNVAADLGVPLIDLTVQATIMYETLGVEESKKLFVFNPDTKQLDNTHFNVFGAYQMAKIVAQGIRKNKLSIAKYLVDAPTFDPAHPDPVGSFLWPVGPKASLTPPAGN